MRLKQYPTLEILFIFLWNSGFIGAEYGLSRSGPFTLLFWRYGLLSVLLGLWLMKIGRMNWPGGKYVWRMGVVGGLAHGVWLSCALIALQLKVPAGIVALITALQPLLTGAVSGIALRERASARQWIGLVLGFIGVAVAVEARLVHDGEAPTWAYILPFISAASMTIASVLQRLWGRGTLLVSLDVSLFFQSVFTVVALFVPAFWIEGLNTSWDFPYISTLIWLELGVSLGAYWTMWKLLSKKEAAVVSSLFYLSPPVTMFMAWLTFGDVLLVSDFLGLAITGVGLIFVYGVEPRLSLSKVTQK
ncbi:MAG: EamA family transporter [Halobacteriovoraceae bacterium]|nr:EamA family transporter [Halobacteriovoraceae bacterium]